MEPLQQFVEQCFVVRDQLALELAVRQASERVQRRAAQALEACQQSEQMHDPRAELALAHQAGLRVGTREDRRREMEAQLVVAFEGALDLLAERRRAVQARYLVL